MEQCCVVIPSFDRPECIRRSTSSALQALANYAQDFPDILEEQAKGVIVVDDGERFQVRDSLSGITDPRLLIVENKGPKGPAQSRNLGSELSSSNLLFFLDDDDLLEPDYIKRIMTHRRSGACTAVWGFSQVSNNRNYRGLPDSSSMLKPSVPLIKRLSGLGTGFWIETDVFRSLGGIDVSLRVNEDTDFCLRLATEGYMPWFEPRRGVRINGAREPNGRDTLSVTKCASASYRAATWEAILSKHSDLLAKNPSLRSLFSGRAAKFRARSGDLRGALEVAWRQRGIARLYSLYQVSLGAISQRRHNRKPFENT